MYCSDPETLTARKPHCCMSCGEIVNPGEKYLRWRCYDSGEVSTIKMHPECHAMHCADSDGGYWEFLPYEHRREAKEMK